jgi:hypothetical protein
MSSVGIAFISGYRPSHASPQVLATVLALITIGLASLIHNPAKGLSLFTGSLTLAIIPTM